MRKQKATVEMHVPLLGIYSACKFGNAIQDHRNEKTNGKN